MEVIMKNIKIIFIILSVLITQNSCASNGGHNKILEYIKIDRAYSNNIKITENIPDKPLPPIKNWLSFKGMKPKIQIGGKGGLCYIIYYKYPNSNYNGSFYLSVYHKGKKQWELSYLIGCYKNGTYATKHESKPIISSQHNKKPIIHTPDRDTTNIIPHISIPDDYYHRVHLSTKNEESIEFDSRSDQLEISEICQHRNDFSTINEKNFILKLSSKTNNQSISYKIDCLNQVINVNIINKKNDKEKTISLCEIFEGHYRSDEKKRPA